MPTQIREFKGRYWFLSNFSPSPMMIDGLRYPTVEHAYHAMKTRDPEEARKIRESLSPQEAKRRGRRVTMRADWNEIKVEVMRRLLQVKFQDDTLRAQLNATAPAVLIEGNWWRDRFWGVYEGVGENWLGRLLMEIRDAD